jgi:urease gamma subunit
MKFSQVALITAVMYELDRQGKEQRPPVRVTVQQLNLNAVIAGVNLMLESLNKEPGEQASG